jgi:penicillin-insensitive murein endopeptidase
VKLPDSGSNFVAYSAIGVAAGRTYVHSKVAEVVGTSYSKLAQISPKTKYVYGESGWASGGRFRPHRSHQNGLSVDFFVPVLNRQGQSVALPIGITNKLGYAIEFDADAKFEDYVIDFAAISEHLYQLHVAGKARGVGIAMVIFDPQYLSKLFATPRGEYVKQNISFMKGKPWVRHDEHYHVDFAVRCQADAS